MRKWAMSDEDSKTFALKKKEKMRNNVWNNNFFINKIYTFSLFNKNIF